MRFALTASLLALAASVAAQTLSDLPPCAASCVGNNLGGCPTYNVQCICSNQQFIAQLSCCVSTACDAADQQKTIQFADQLCDTVGVTLPSQASCAPGQSATAASSSAGSSSTMSGNSTMSMSGNSTMSMTSSSSGSSQSATGSAASGSSGGSSSAASGSGNAANAVATPVGLGMAAMAAIGAMVAV